MKTSPMNKSIFVYGKTSYEYFILYQERKTIALTVQPNSHIILKCPPQYDVEKIEKFLKKKWLWIEKQLRYFQKYKQSTEKKEYVSGESFLYLGRQYKLLVQSAKKSEVHLAHGRITIHTSKNVRNSEENKKLLQQWFSDRTKAVFHERFAAMLKKFNYEFMPELVIRKMSKRWGSYLSKKKIILNPLLIRASKECIDYVITHELCHMRHKNHTKQFFLLLESKMPGWEKVKEKLELRFL
jgi:predicted metal-dependent hydrolase